MQSKYLVPGCCNCDSLKFDMQYDYILKKWKFDLLTSSPKSGGCGVSAGKTFFLYHVAV